MSRKIKVLIIVYNRVVAINCFTGLLTIEKNILKLFIDGIV
ncbi:hypothetical protein J559_1759 [Acinetobacter sp. 983759]|nr:hypothetical protein J546_1252 [Acinetobacter sp. 1461402]EXB70058.1 hypothetical protein J550_2519 [Acinetobacter sp. 230853]EXC25710.1 hypothetical protein J520_3033 [Acinetobacter sp. 869535]EXE14100.1 hypothetical protein J559_1759 [Acinetobacter sp. 983759]